MDKRLNDIGYDFINYTLTLPTEMQEIIDEGFRIEQDCILMTGSQYFGPGDLDNDFKKTQYEEFLNDIHITDYLKDTVDEIEYLKIGVEFGKRLYDGLQKEFQTDFRVIISYSETSYTGQEIDSYADCVIKFYKIRQDGDDKFKIVDLNEFETEAVMVIE